MPAVPVIFYVASAALTAASMAQQNKAAKAGQKLATDTATYNANIDIAQAQQLDLDTTANLRTERAQDQVYISRQKTAYAAAGVLSSGSPLSVEATTAGRLEQSRQQEYVNAQQKQQYLYGAAKEGIAVGDAQSHAIRIQNTANMLSGGAKLLSTFAGGYSSGAFSFGGGGGGGGFPTEGWQLAG